jgi:uncharacterized protein YbcI
MAETEHERAGLEEEPIARQVSRAMMRLYKEQFGRGPERAWTYHCGDDMIVSLIVNSLTPVERSLRELGDAQGVRDIRMRFQHATEPHFRSAVEEATGRRVIGFMSGMDVANDLASEVFTLEPR